MRIVRYLVVVAPTLLALLVVSHIGAAQTSSPQIENARVAGPQADWLPFTRTVTVTIEAGPALAPALSSYWQTSIADFSTSAGGTWSVALPSDATDVTATITGGTCQIGNTIVFSFTDSVADFAWSYRTSQKVLRQGHQYQVDQYASINQGPFVYISTVFLTSPYQYVGQIGPAPVMTGTSSVHWETSVLTRTDDGRYIFSSAMWLADPRLAQSDLKITAGKAFTLPGSSRVHVTAAIQNGGVITTGAPVYINIYNRRAPSGQPSDPMDLAGGWCSLDRLAQPVCPSFSSTVGITNFLRVIGPGKIITLAADLTPTLSGRLDIWMQVDIFGGPAGLNLEPNEDDNWSYLGQVSLYRIDLPLIVKGYQAP